MLIQTLRGLERDGLLTRTVTPSVPVRVDYELTPLGLSLLEPIHHLKTWAEAHMPEVDAHRTPLAVVDEFGLIDTLHTGRLDLGLGRSGKQLFAKRRSRTPRPPGRQPDNGLLVPRPRRGVREPARPMKVLITEPVGGGRRLAVQAELA